MRRLFIVGMVVFLFARIAVAADDKTVAPSQLPRTHSTMFAPGFWISQHPFPDQEMLNPVAINALNQYIQDELKLTNDVFTTVSNERNQELLFRLEQNITDFTQKGYYTLQGVRNDKDFIERAKQNMHLTAVVLGVVPRYGIITRFTDQRFFPTTEGLYERLGDVDFDELQNSGLDVGTPVAIVHASRDHQWVYVYGPISDGWVKATDVGMGNQEQVSHFVSPKKFVVVTAAFTDVFSDRTRSRLLTTVRMGVKLPLVGIEDGIASVQFPQRDAQGKLIFVEGFMDRRDLNEGFLPMTPRHFYTQAFRWLHTPYGWGDFRGFIDCSRLVQSVYATFGVVLPRDSKNQAKVGKALADFTDESTGSQKLAVLATTPIGSLLVLKGHIMVYLGSINQVNYVMHATSGYRQREGSHDVMRSLMKVVVSDLSLGEGSSKGSLLKRLNRILTIEKPDAHLSD